jgi:penicillin-binding protein 1C
MLPTENCKSITNDFYIKNISPLERCSLYKELYVSSDEKLQYCPNCLPDSGYKKKFYPVYSPELTTWMISNNIPFSKPPEHNPGCIALFSNEGPGIISPSKNFQYFIEKDSKQEIKLQAASDSRVKKHYWYINGSYFNKCLPGAKLFFKPTAGKNIITCLDDKGRKTEICIDVKFY